MTPRMNKGGKHDNSKKNLRPVEKNKTDRRLKESTSNQNLGQAFTTNQISSP
jgi:hypothetical protein